MTTILHDNLKFGWKDVIYIIMLVISIMLFSNKLNTRISMLERDVEKHNEVMKEHSLEMIDYRLMQMQKQLNNMEKIFKNYYNDKQND